MKRTSSMAFATPASRSKFKKPRTVSAKLASLSTRVNRILRAEEVKAVDYNQPATPFTTTGVIIPISEVNQGDGSFQRDGRNLYWKNLHMSVHLTSQTGDVRFIVFRTVSDGISDNIFPTKVLEQNIEPSVPINPRTQYSLTHVPGEYKILYDNYNGVAFNRGRTIGTNPFLATATATPGIVGTSHSFTVPVNALCSNGGSLGNTGLQNLYVLVIADAITSTYRFNSRVTYTDS